jgi:hypothetical protein
MGSGRFPGPYGSKRAIGCVYYQPVLGAYPGMLSHDAIPYMTPGVWGRNNDLGAWVAKAMPDITDEDKRELRLLQKTYGVASGNSSRPYVTYQKRKRVDHVENYLKDRDAFFGADYQAYKRIAEGELDADKAKLRKVIEPNTQSRKSNLDWSEAQTIFYCWVRKAIENHPSQLKSASGGTISIPTFILSGQSPRLTQALGKVKSTYTKKFHAGGANARPQKHGGKYILGTLSDHALGTAVDIDDSTNAQIVALTWSHILAFTGKALDHKTRKSKWKSDPKSLYDSVSEINTSFVAKLAETIKVAEAKAPAGSKADALTLAMNANDDLKKIGHAFLNRWQKGFFSLEWELVDAFHETKFLWGATFSDVDLHHFQL